MTSLNKFIGFVAKKPFALLGMTAGLTITSTLVYIFFKRFVDKKTSKGRDKSIEIKFTADNDEWIEIGSIKMLYYYPLKSGRGKAIENCHFTDYGISVEKEGLITLRDRMLLVYDGKTGKFQTGRNYPKLILIDVSPVGEKSVKFETDGMPSIVISLPEINNDETNDRVKCSMWWGEELSCIDCGPEAAIWITKFLTGGTDLDLRIGSATSKRRNVYRDPWEKFTKVYRNLRNEDTGYFADIASYMLMTESSLDELNERLNENVGFLQFRPNIVVTGCRPFDEDFWEWIKIGKSALLRNVKPCSRCSMIRVNPEFGTVDKREPTEALRSFREQTDPKRIELEGKAPIMGIYCGSYSLGPVKIGDKVFIRYVKKQS